MANTIESLEISQLKLMDDRISISIALSIIIIIFKHSQQ